MKTLAAIILSVSFIGLLSGPAHATTADEREFKELVSKTSRLSQIYFTMTLAGASPESIQAIRNDLQKRALPEKLPQANVINNEITLGGRKTGLTVLSYSPPRIEFKGQIWTYSARQSMDQNYFSLVKILENDRKIGGFSFINEANALEGDRYVDAHQIIGGGLIMVASLICVFTEPCGLVAGLTMAAVGGGIGVAAQLPRRVKVTCSKTKSSISNASDGDFYGSFEVLKRPGGTYTVKHAVRHVFQSYEPYQPADKEGFARLAKCETPQDAAKIEASLNEKLSAALNAGSNGHSFPPTDPGKPATVTK